MTLLWSGLAVGAVYALVAITYNIVFVASGTFNFANAQLVMVGTFIAYAGLVTFHWPVWLVAIVAMLGVALITVIEERIAVRPVPDSQTQLVTTLGAATLLTGITQVVWGSQPLTVPFFGSESIISLFGGRIYPVEVSLIGVAVLLVIVLTVLSQRTVTGIALLAMAEDREAAVLRGANVRLLTALAFAGSGALAGGLGLFVGPKTYAVATLGSSLAIMGFVALALGGFGSLLGSLIGGLVVGVVNTMASRYWGADYGQIAVFCVFIVILMVRPAGLFGTVKERVV